MKLKQIIYDGLPYMVPSWEEMGNLTFLLSKMIMKSDQTYDRVIGLAKGGWTWVKPLVDYLNIENIGSIQIKFYQDIGKTSEEPKIVQPLGVKIRGENILLFDDVADSGKTLLAAQKHLKRRGAKRVDIATLFYKPFSKVKPNYFGYETRAWVIFPHEIRETIELLGKKWLASGLGKKEVTARFLKLGLSEDEVDFFVRIV